MTRMIMLTPSTTVKKKLFKIMSRHLYNGAVMTIRDFHSTGHGRIYEYTETANRTARTAAASFQIEGFHRRDHKHSPSRERITPSSEKKI